MYYSVIVEKLTAADLPSQISAFLPQNAGSLPKLSGGVEAYIPEIRKYVGTLRAEQQPEKGVVAISIWLESLTDSMLAMLLDEAESFSDLFVEGMKQGYAVLRHIQFHQCDTHPSDKTHLLLYLERQCARYNLSRMKTLGFNHDIEYSVEPFDDFIKVSLDNELYIPPSRGHWRIVGRGAARD